MDLHLLHVILISFTRLMQLIDLSHQLGYRLKHLRQLCDANLTILARVSLLNRFCLSAHILSLKFTADAQLQGCTFGRGSSPTLLSLGVRCYCGRVEEFFRRENEMLGRGGLRTYVGLFLEGC